MHAQGGCPPIRRWKILHLEQTMSKKTQLFCSIGKYNKIKAEHIKMRPTDEQPESNDHTRALSPRGAVPPAQQTSAYITKIHT